MVVMTLLFVLLAWVVLSVPLGILFGAVCGHQDRRAERLSQPPARRPVPAPRLPVRAGSAA